MKIKGMVEGLGIFPREGEPVGQCGTSGNPRVIDVVFDDEAWVKVFGLSPFRCNVARDTTGHLQAVRLLEWPS